MHLVACTLHPPYGLLLEGRGGTGRSTPCPASVQPCTPGPLRAQARTIPPRTTTGRGGITPPSHWGGHTRSGPRSGPKVTGGPHSHSASSTEAGQRLPRGYVTSPASLPPQQTRSSSLGQEPVSHSSAVRPSDLPGGVNVAGHCIAGNIFATGSTTPAHLATGRLHSWRAGAALASLYKGLPYRGTGRRSSPTPAANTKSRVSWSPLTCSSQHEWHPAGD